MMIILCVVRVYIIATNVLSHSVIKKPSRDSATYPNRYIYVFINEKH